MFVERLEDNRLRLYITRIEEGDEGQYTCEADVNKITLSAHNDLSLYGQCRICSNLCFISISMRKITSVNNRPITKSVLYYGITLLH